MVFLIMISISLGLLSYDKKHPPEALAICAASAAMAISPVPMIRPVAGK